MEILAATPSNVRLTVFATPARTVAVTVPVDKTPPVALAPAYTATANVCAPTVAVTVAVQLYPWDADPEQFGEAGARFTTVGVPPSTLIAADCVAAETYCGTRRTADAAVADGTKMDIFTLRDPLLGVVPLPVGVTTGSDELVVPPLHAAREMATRASANNRVNTTPQIRPKR
jgi:hypothetical protein